jgi:hypothetical protein
MNGTCPPSQIYLFILFEYFKISKNRTDDENLESVSFFRRNLNGTEASWSGSQKRLLPDVEILEAGKIGDSFYGVLEVDFANKDVSFGRGIFSILPQHLC